MLFERICVNAFRKKALNFDPTHSDLKKCLSLGDLIFLSIGGMVGGGIYVLTGTVAHEFAGPSVILSYIIAAFVAGLSAVCYAEFGARVPIAGSAYQFTYISIGEFWAFVIGWNVLVEHIVAVSGIAKVWSANFDAAVHNAIRTYLQKHCPLPGGDVLSSYPDFIAAAVILITVCILLTGVKPSATINAFFTAANLAVVAVIVGVGCYFGSTRNWFDVEGGFFAFGASGLMSGAATLVYAYIGFEILTCAVEEAKNPTRDIPLSLIISLSIVAIAYVCAAISLTLMVPYNEIDVGAPFPNAFQRYGLHWAKYLVTVGVLVATYAPVIAMQYVAPRYLLAMARDGLLPPVLAKVHPSTNAPYTSTLVCGFLSMLVATIFKVEILVQFMSIGQLLAWAFVAICVIKLRYEPKDTGYERMEEHVEVETSIQSSTTAPANEGTPLHPLSKTQLTAVAQEGTVCGRSDPCSTTSVCYERIQKAGSLKQVVLESRFRNSFWVRMISSRRRGTVPKWILAIAITTGFIATTIARFGNVETATPAAVSLAIFASLSIFSISSLQLFEQETSTKTFKVPFVPFLPFSAVIVNMYFILSFQPATWLRLVVWLGIGLVVYCGYGYRNSVEGHSQ